MASNSYPVIAREGWPLLAILLVILILSWQFLGVLVTAVVFLVLLFFIFILRDPYREIPSSPLSIVSPISGRILGVSQVDDPWIDRYAKMISIKSSFFDVYSIRSPAEGKIVNQWTRRPEGNDNKRRFAYRLRTDEDDEIVVVINLNFITAFFLRFYAHSGERIGHGQRCGFLFFGGRVDVLIPDNSKVNVAAGDTICSGSGVLGHLVHRESTSTETAAT